VYLNFTLEKKEKELIMKKLFIGLMVAGLIMFGTNVFGETGGELFNTQCNGVGNQNSPCGGFGDGPAEYSSSPATATAFINPTAGGASFDSAVAVSPKLPGSWTILNWNLGGDDGAWAEGGSGGSSENLGTAAAGTLIPFRNTTAFALGNATAQGATHAGAFALDIGLSIPYINYPLGPQLSVAGSAIGTVVNVTADGASGFAGMGILGGGIAYNESTGIVEGSVVRGSYVNEINSGLTWAQGSEESAANFYGTTKDTDLAVDGAFFGSYGDTARSGIDMTGAAFSAGGSIAYIEPNGDTQFAFAAVGNMAVAGVQGADYQNNHVSGRGDAAIQAYAENNSGYAVAGATGSFSYSGGVAGAGVTIMQSSATVGPSSFSSQASGASFATSN